MNINEINIIKPLQLSGNYQEALARGIRALNVAEARNLVTEMIYEILPIYEKECPDDKAIRELLDFSVKYHNNRNQSNMNNLMAAIPPASIAAAAAAAFASAATISVAIANVVIVIGTSVIGIANVTEAAATIVYIITETLKFDNVDYENVCNRYIDKIINILRKAGEE